MDHACAAPFHRDLVTHSRSSCLFASLPLSFLLSISDRLPFSSSFDFEVDDRTRATLQMPPQNTHRHRESFTLPDYRSIDLPLRTCTFVLGNIETSGFAIIYSYLRTFHPSFLRQTHNPYLLRLLIYGA